MFFGTIGFNFLFNMIFTYRYCRMLEEGSFRGRTADFFFMFLFGGFLMTVSFLCVSGFPKLLKIAKISVCCNNFVLKVIF